MDADLVRSPGSRKERDDLLGSVEANRRLSGHEVDEEELEGDSACRWDPPGS